MKILTELKAGKTTVAAEELVYGVAVVASEPVTGVIRRVTLGRTGVVIERPVVSGEKLQVRIPLDELLRIAEAAEPKLKASKVEATAAAEAAKV